MRVKVLLATVAVSTVFLTGCNSIDMGAINDMTQAVGAITNDVNTITTKSAGIDVDAINSTVDEFNTAVQEITDATAPTVEAINGISEDFMVVTAHQFTDDELAEILDGTPIGNVMSVSERGNQAVASAQAKYAEGISMINEGYAGLNNVGNEAQTIKGGVAATFDYAELMMNGANTAVEAVTILLKEYSAMGNDILEVAEVLGVDVENDENMSLLKEILDIAENDVEIYFIAPEAIDMVEDTKAELLVALNNPDTVDLIDVDPEVDQIFDNIMVLTDTVDAVNQQISDIYQQANKSAQGLIESVEIIGTGDATVDATLGLVDETLKAYENVEIIVADSKMLGDYVNAARQQVKDQISLYKEQFKQQLESEKN